MSDRESKPSPGDRVMIYQDPYTQEEPEGEAMLVQLIQKERESDYTVERWLVRFPDGDYERTIVTRDCGAIPIFKGADVSCHLPRGHDGGHEFVRRGQAS